MSKTLRALVISENPLVEATDCRMSALMLLPYLERLDKDPVSPEERAEAQERIKVQIIFIRFVTRSDKDFAPLTFSSHDMFVISGTQ